MNFDFELTDKDKKRYKIFGMEFDGVSNFNKYLSFSLKNLKKLMVL